MLVFGRPVGWQPLEVIAEVLGVTAKRARRLAFRGPLPAQWWSGELMVNEDHLAAFVAEQRRW